MFGFYTDVIVKKCHPPSTIRPHTNFIHKGRSIAVTGVHIAISRNLLRRSWTSYQIRKIAVCACARNAGNVFPRRRFQSKPLVSDPGMHHGTCVTHVPWCMSGSLTCGDGENVPGIPGACAPAILRIWQEAHAIWTLYDGFPVNHPLIARFTGPTWAPSGADRTPVGPMLAPWTLLSGSWRHLDHTTENEPLQHHNKFTNCEQQADCVLLHNVRILLLHICSSPLYLSMPFTTGKIYRVVTCIMMECNIS